MIDEQRHTVSLSTKDWVGIVAVAVSVVGATMSAFVHHDRTLATLVAQQVALESRLSKMELALERSRYGSKD